MALKSGTPIDTRTALQDNRGLQSFLNFRTQRSAEAADTVGRAASKYFQKQEEKKEKEIRLQALQDLFPKGTDEGLIKALANDEEAFPAAIQYAELKQDQMALNKALAFNTDTSGKVDMSNVVNTYLELGGRDAQMAQRLTSKAQENEYKASLMEMEKSNREALTKAVANSMTPEGKFDGTYAMRTFQEFGGQDVEKAAKVFNALSEGGITIQEVNDYALVSNAQGEPKFLVPPEKSEEREEVAPEARRTEVISRARKLFNEGKLDEADDLILGLGIRDNVTGMLVNAAALFGSAGATEPATGEQTQPDPLGIR